jgi:hypothetical protein
LSASLSPEKLPSSGLVDQSMPWPTGLESGAFSGSLDQVAEHVDAQQAPFLSCGAADQPRGRSLIAQRFKGLVADASQQVKRVFQA